MRRLAGLFWDFFRISLFVIGGGYAILAVADSFFAKKGLTKEGELFEHLPIFQSVPGLIAANTAVYIGDKVAGIWGAALCVLAVAIPSIFVFTIVAAGYGRIPVDNPLLQAAFIGLQSAVSGIVLAGILRTWRKTMRDAFSYGMLLGVLFLILSFGTAPALVLAALGGIVRELWGRQNANHSRHYNASWLPLLVFVRYGCLCFGGGFALIPMYVEDFVGETARFLQVDLSEFSNVIAMAQMTPGPVGINCATYFGYRLAGISGSVLASLLLIMPGMLLCYAAIHSIKRFQTSRLIIGIMRGMRPASIALLVSALGALLPWGHGYFPFLLIVITTTLSAFTQASPVLIILFSGAVGMAIL